MNSEQFLPEEYLDAYVPEKSEDQTFRWFKQVALLRYTLAPGKYSLKMSIFPIVSKKHLKNTCFYMKGRQLSSKIDWDKKNIFVAFEVVDHNITEIGFITPGLNFSEDTRMLGLPVIDIQIAPQIDLS